MAFSFSTANMYQLLNLGGGTLSRESLRNLEEPLKNELVTAEQQRASATDVTQIQLTEERLNKAQNMIDTWSFMEAAAPVFLTQNPETGSEEISKSRIREVANLNDAGPETDIVERNEAEELVKTDGTIDNNDIDVLMQRVPAVNPQDTSVTEEELAEAEAEEAAEADAPPSPDQRPRLPGLPPSP